MRMISVNAGNLEDAALECQRYCADTATCEHFTLSGVGAARMCILGAAGALRMEIMGNIAGPAKCASAGGEGNTSLVSLFRVESEETPSARPHSRLLWGATTLGAVALTAAVALL